MRIITKQRIREWAVRYRDAAVALEAWYKVARRARWASLAEVRRDFPTADGIQAESRRIVTVFNIRGGHYRMITAIHYNRQRVFMMRFLTHREYDADRWKREL